PTKYHRPFPFFAATAAAPGLTTRVPGGPGGPSHDSFSSSANIFTEGDIARHSGRDVSKSLYFDLKVMKA
ncbi:hypothetical protein, partial [Thiohalocapsa marina]|uniref:hypothetical protein n=1 Tax=Thiohalocapsa marina TaxID=424902 RepID=UPI001B86DB51